MRSALRLPLSTLAALALACSDYKLAPGGAVDGDTAASDPGRPDDQPPEGTDDTGGGGDTQEADTAPPEPADVPVGRVLTILLTLSDDWMDPTISEQLILNAAAWTGPTADPKILVIRDDNHGGEDTEDSENIYDHLIDGGFDATLLDEPSAGIDAAALDGYQLAILSNPGHPPDDLATLQALYDFSRSGYGIIFQGDDIAHFSDTSAFDMSSLTRLTYVDNGTEYYGYTIDDNESGAYAVTLETSGEALLDGIAGETFRYGNDIDTTEIASADVTVLATGTVEGTTAPSKPVIVAYDP